MSASDFKVGDEVEFEMSDAGSPLWNYGKKSGLPTGKWIEGEVEGVWDYDEINVKYKYNGHPGYWIFPTDKENLARPGYVRKIGSRVPVATSSCKCDMMNVWNFGHNNDCPERSG